MWCEGKVWGWGEAWGVGGGMGHVWGWGQAWGVCGGPFPIVHVCSPVRASSVMSSSCGHLSCVSVDGLQVVKTNQFSVTRHKKTAQAQAGDSGLPGT